MCPSCPSCGFRLERETGYWLGAYFFNLMAVEIVFCAYVGGVLLLTWPTPPWSLLQYGAIALMLLTPVLFFPFSKTLFLAFDLLFRPADPEDFREPHEAALNLTRPRRN